MILAMKTQLQTTLHKLGGYYLIPHELLHVLAFRIIGKPCEYHWGNDYVRPLARETKREWLFVSLFPFAVIMGLGLFFGLLWVSSAFFIKIRPERYFIDGPTWHFIFFIMSALFALYATSAEGDIISSIGVLFFNKEIDYDGPEPHQQPHEKQSQRQSPQSPHHLITDVLGRESLATKEDLLKSGVGSNNSKQGQPNDDIE